MSFSVLPQRDDDKQEDGYNATRASYVTAPPSGVLSVHVKSLKLDENQFSVPEPEVYIRVRAGSVSKSTRIVSPIKGKGITIINDVKNFSLILARDRSAPHNQVRFDLIMVVTSHLHRILGHKDMHIYDIIKNLYAAGTYDLRFRHQHVAYVEMELCFAYGIFGFGYSHQLENRQAKAVDIVGHSLLYRDDPPESRKQSDSLVMAPIHVKHPEFINFNEKMKIGPAARQELETTDLDPFQDLDKEEPDLLMKKMRKRLDQIQLDYSQLADRMQRKKFLEKMILRKVEDQQQETAFGDPPTSDNHSSGHHRPGPLKGSSKTTGQPPNLPNSDFVTVDQSETEYEEGELDVIDMTSILANAPGIVGRVNLRDNKALKLARIDEFSDDSGSRSTLGTATIGGNDRNVSNHEDYQPQSNTSDLQSTILNRFSNRLRMWRERGARVAPTGPSSVATDQAEPSGESPISESRQFRHRPNHQQNLTESSQLTGSVTPSEPTRLEVIQKIIRDHPIGSQSLNNSGTK